MALENIQELPRFGDRLSYLYVERARVDQDQKAIAIHQFDGTTQVPVASLAVLMLGPGTTLTHAAIKCLAENIGRLFAGLGVHSCGQAAFFRL
jgi:CRISPR-associated protein Cas1